MKTLGLLLSLGLSLGQGLWAQNLVTHRTQYAYDFGTEAYLLNAESNFEYDDAEQLIFQRYASWQADRTYPNLAYETSFTYHTDGNIETRLSKNYRLDTLEGGYWSQFDTRGNLIQDSSFYRNQDGKNEYYASRLSYTYDSQDRLREVETESKNLESPNWLSTDFRLYTYNQNGCLTEIASGNSRSEPTYRTRSEYDQDCRLTASFQEYRQGFGNWQGSERTYYTYTQASDSSTQSSRIEYFRNDLNAWSIIMITRQVYNDKEQLIRSYTEFENGAAGENIYRYDEAGNQIYERAAFREFQTGQWYYWHERFVLENSATREVNLQKGDWDTIRQQFLRSNLWEQISDTQDRLLEQNIIDSIWDGTSFEIFDRQISFQYENYCDGLVKTQFQREGAAGLASQPTAKVEFGYLKAAECISITDDISLQIHPNPASHLVMLSSELLLNPETSIRVVDLRGSTVKTFSNTGRQSKLTLDIRDLKAGMYIIQLNHPERQLSEQLYKQ